VRGRDYSKCLVDWPPCLKTGYHVKVGIVSDYRGVVIEGGGGYYAVSEGDPVLFPYLSSLNGYGIVQGYDSKVALYGL